MKEHEHYEVNVRIAGEAHYAVILCKICGKNYYLGKKSGKPMISSWTRHIITCLDSPYHVSRGRRKIDSYFSRASAASQTSGSMPQGSSTSFELLSGNLAIDKKRC